MIEFLMLTSLLVIKHVQEYIQTSLVSLKHSDISCPPFISTSLDVHNEELSTMGLQGSPKYKGNINYKRSKT